MTCKYFLLIVVISVLPISSCSDKSSDIIFFTEDSFKEKIKLTNGLNYKIENLILAHPTQIRFHPDSFLVIQDYDTPTPLTILDFKSKKVLVPITRGRGPGEALHPFGIHIIGKNLYIFDGQLNKVIVLAPDQNRIFKVKNEYFIKERIFKFFPVTETLSVSLSDLEESKRLNFIDNKGNIIRRMGDFPPLYNSDIKGDNYIFQSSISATPDGKRIVLACLRTDIIEIFDTNKGLIRRLQGPVGIKLKAQRQYMGKFYTTTLEPSYSTNGNIISNDREFWVDYKIYKLKRGVQPTLNEAYPQKIMCFDWKGNPLRIIEFEHNFLCINADWKNKILYAFVWIDYSPELMIYSLKNIIK